MYPLNAGNIHTYTIDPTQTQGEEYKSEKLSTPMIINKMRRDEFHDNFSIGIERKDKWRAKGKGDEIGHGQTFDMRAAKISNRISRCFCLAVT